MNSRLFRYALLALALLLPAAGQWLHQRTVKEQSDPGIVARRAEKAYHQLRQRSEVYIEQIAQQNNPAISFSDKKFHPPDGLTLFIYRNDSLVYWSDNTIEPEFSDLRPGVRFFHNGYYDFIPHPVPNGMVAGLLKIKNQYAFQNRYLHNHFNADLHIPDHFLISDSTSEGAIAVHDHQQRPAFYLTADPSGSPTTPSLWPAVLFLSGLFLGGVFILLSLTHFRNELILAPAAILVYALIIRLAGLLFQFPTALYDYGLFSPTNYASSFLLNSVGDLLLTSLIIALMVIIFYRLPFTRKGFRHPQFHPLFSTSLSIILIFIYSAFIHQLISGLIINSRIPFNIGNIFELNAYSLAGVLIICILLFTFYKVADGNLHLLRHSTSNRYHIPATVIITMLALTTIHYIFSDRPVLKDFGTDELIFTMGIILCLHAVRNIFNNLPYFTRGILVILLFSLFGAYVISDFNEHKERENRKVLAAKLENEQDQVAEYLFDDISKSIASDRIIARFFAAPYEEVLASVENNDVIGRRMTQLYFTGYWSRYDVKVRCFNSDGLPINTGGDPSWSMDYFQNRIRESSRTTANPYLWFSGNISGRISYTAMIPVFDPGNPAALTGNIAVLLESKLLQGEGGFPELLLSDKVPYNNDLLHYSYARYRDGLLVNQSGSYHYPVNFDEYLNFLKRSNDPDFLHYNGYCHLFYQTGKNGMLILSAPRPSLPEFITFFSYLFSFFGLCFLIAYLVSLLFRGKHTIAFNFKSRIQATVVAVVIATMALTVTATVWYFNNNHQQNISNTINERMRLMMIAISNELSDRSLNTIGITDELNYTFSKLSETLNTDFNIYSNDGRLIYTTRPKIYDQNLIAKTIEPQALYALTKGNESLHIRYEQIGGLSFLSAYEPVRNNNNQLLGYINLPYFAKQDELKENISSFMVALINIYVLLFAFAILITFFISNRITRPLQLIQQRLSKTSLGKRNEPIEWKRDDEIGALVKEYNRMVDELSASAELLARSERESAWREMAKQVAHEIKNPLTPMKLSVQHMQRAWKEKSSDMEGIMQRLTQTLIEQIDTLSNIANEFSNFAKMPKPQLEEIDLSPVIKNMVSLFSGNENITITYYEHPGKPYRVYADREQLIRVFSNLMKNAVQAIPEDIKGHIHLELKKQDSMNLISVNDNGSGIPIDEQPKIFTPNFTTKTGGMGLGLAMVKSIVESAGGSVTFQSKEGEGSEFMVMLPETKD